MSVHRYYSSLFVIAKNTLFWVENFEVVQLWIGSKVCLNLNLNNLYLNQRLYKPNSSGKS